jgi:hypothetical protein
MTNLVFIATIAVLAFLVAWVVNGLVGLLSGERPRDTGSLWLDAFLRMFAVLELGIIGRILNYIGLDGLPRKLVLFVGLLCLLLFFIGACDHQDSEQTYAYPAQSQ